MLRFSLTDSVLLTIFLPGAICLIGIGWFAFPWIWSSITTLISSASQSSGTHLPDTGILITGCLAVAAFLAFFLAMFLGELRAVIIWYVEFYGLDSWQARRLKIGWPEYENQWQRYLDSLEKAHNSYVTKQVNAFHFQARSGLALLLLALLVLASPTKPALAWMSAVVLAAVLFKAAFDDHGNLATFRKRRFAVKPGPTTRPEELLGALWNAWCTRAAVKPLGLILPVLEIDGKTITDTAKTRDAVLKVARLPDSEILPSEKCMLCLVNAALSERANAGV